MHSLMYQGGLQPRPANLWVISLALWIAVEANALEVSRIVGHTQVNFTLNRYGHLFPTSDADLVNCINLVIQHEQEQDKNYE